jgi:hypothetical protein
MSEWWTYELSDFLLFSHRVYVRLFELHNEALWPAQVVTLLIGAGILGAMVNPGRLAPRVVPLALGTLWLWIAWSFFGQRYATINWAALYVAPVFAAQGLALIALAAGPGLALPDRHCRGALPPAGVIVLALAVLTYPLVAPALGRPLAAAEVFGIAPDPTAVATLAILSASRGRARWLLMAVPLLWCVITGLTHWTMSAPEVFIAPASALLCAVVAGVERPRRCRPQTR